MIYAKELKDKLAVASYDEVARRKILMLCGERFHLHQDALEDFVAF